MAPWLEIGAFTAGAGVESLVGNEDSASHAAAKK